MSKQFAKKSIASKLIFPAVVAAALFTTSTQAANNFEIVRGISDGSPYPLTSDGAATPLRAANQSDDWFEQQRSLTDGAGFDAQAATLSPRMAKGAARGRVGQPAVSPEGKLARTKNGN